ncbi:hypothetical protein GP486_004218, partial [Trichoglossum hirsutum]
MAWGNSKPPPAGSALSKVAPLLIFFVLVGVVAAVLLQVAKTASDIADNAGKKLEKKNVLVTKDGVKVGVKEVRNEKYVDRTQRCASSFLIHPMLSTSPADGFSRLSTSDDDLRMRVTDVWSLIFTAFWLRHGISQRGQPTNPVFGISRRSSRNRGN